MTRVNYKGSSVHERTITQADLEAADVDFGGYEMPTLTWAAGEARRSIELPDDMPESVKTTLLEILKNEGTFEVKEGNETVAEADPDADRVRADGSDVNGNGGSEVLASTLGPGEVAGSTSGGAAAPSTSTSATRRTSTTGGSTSGS